MKISRRPPGPRSWKNSFPIKDTIGGGDPGGGGGGSGVVGVFPQPEGSNRAIARSSHNLLILNIAPSYSWIAILYGVRPEFQVSRP